MTLLAWQELVEHIYMELKPLNIIVTQRDTSVIKKEQNTFD